MQEDTSVPGRSSASPLRYLLKALYRRRFVVRNTFMMVLALGVLVTFTTKPVYQTSARILIEGSQFSINMGRENPLSSILTGDQGHDTNTQLEVLQGERVLSDAYKDADVPPGSSTLQVHQVGNTNDVIELVVESSTPTYAERLAKTIPNTYLNYCTGNRRTEIANAQQFADSRLREENDKLLEAEIRLERWKVKMGITDATADRARSMARVDKIEAEIDGDQATLLNARAVLARMIENKKSTPAQVKSSAPSDNPAIKATEDEIALLQASRAQALTMYTERNPEIVRMDRQIEDMETKLRILREHATSVPNPKSVAYEAKISEMQDTIAITQTMLKDAQARLEKAQNGINNFGQLERMQAQMTRDMDLHRDAVMLLIKSKEDLDLRAKATHDPVLTIAPAQAAVQVAPHKARNFLYAGLLGLLLGVCFAFLLDFSDRSGRSVGR